MGASRSKKWWRDYLLNSEGRPIGPRAICGTIILLFLFDVVVGEGGIAGNTKGVQVPLPRVGFHFPGWAYHLLFVPHVTLSAQSRRVLNNTMYEPLHATGNRNFEFPRSTLHGCKERGKSVEPRT